MVCIPCIVIPVALWVFYKFIQPIILKFWNPWAKSSVTANSAGDSGGDGVSLEESVKQSPEYKYIQQKITENKVMVFSKTTCSYCEMAKRVLNEVGVQYQLEEIDLRPDTDKLQDIFSKLTGARTVPRVFIGGKCIGGGSETWSLHNQGRLLPLLKEAGASFKKSD